MSLMVAADDLPGCMLGLRAKIIRCRIEFFEGGQGSSPDLPLLKLLNEEKIKGYYIPGKWVAGLLASQKGGKLAARRVDNF